MRWIHQGEFVQAMLAVCCACIVALSVNGPLIAGPFFSSSFENQAAFTAPAQVPAQAHCAALRMQRAAQAIRAHYSTVNGLPAQAVRFGEQSVACRALERTSASFLSGAFSLHLRDRAPPSR